MASKKVNKVIKGLETCAGVYGKTCKGCPYYVNTNRSKCLQMYKDALELIKSLQEQIDKLTAEKKTTKKSKAGAENEQPAEQ